MTTSIPESRGEPAQLGLPLLLAARRLLRGQRAQPPRTRPRTMERYLDFIINTAAGANGADLQPVYSVTGKASIVEREAASLPGYRGMGPVRIGNQAYAQQPARRLRRRGARRRRTCSSTRGSRCASDQALFRAARAARASAPRRSTTSPTPARGSCAATTARAHLLERDVLGGVRPPRARSPRASAWRTARSHWRGARRRACTRRSASAPGTRSARSFAATFGGEHLDASLLLLHELDFLRADDPRFARHGARGREGPARAAISCSATAQADDFGVPENAFAVCTFWYIDALAALGRTRRGARALRA